MLARIIVFLLIGLIGRAAFAQPDQMRPAAMLPAYSADAGLHGVFFLDPDTGWACGDRGTVLVTINGGASWEVVSTGHEGTLRHIHFKNAKEGIALGGRSIGLPGQSEGLLLETVDGG